MALLGLGFRRLSMSPAGVGPVKAMIRCVTLEGLAEYMTQLIGTPTYSLRSNLRNYAQDHGIPF
jgi:phosphotransferase system enzyme I (PtsP)